jgi:hypothetical protein
VARLKFKVARESNSGTDNVANTFKKAAKRAAIFAAWEVASGKVQVAR